MPKVRDAKVTDEQRYLPKWVLKEKPHNRKRRESLKRAFSLNHTTYNWPSQPIVIICVDGGDPAYIEEGLRQRALPTFERFMRDGFYTIANGSMPSFTCPNNMSIVTGAEPAVHGISGNYYLDSTTNEPVTMTGPELLRSKTILAEFARLGAKVITVTAKDKLRLQLQKGLPIKEGNISFSAQHAASCSLAENGIEGITRLVGKPEPDMYSAQLSLFVLDAGIKLLERYHPDIMYLSLTDFIQHKFAPHETEAITFYQALDQRLLELEERGALIGLTADHGMNDKANEVGEPNVIWLQDILDRKFGRNEMRVICPITDPFVVHHGTLGGLVRVYLKDITQREHALSFIREHEGVESIWEKYSAARVFEMPPDREGDLVVIGDAHTCLGARESEHDLNGLEGYRLRTHGGISESLVPFMLSRPLNPDYWNRAVGKRLRSHELFDFAINGSLSLED